MTASISQDQRLANLETAVFEGPNVGGATNRNPNVRNVRIRTAIADINSGAVLLPAIPGLKYRFIDSEVISVGGAVGALTLLIITATQGGAVVNILTHTQASLTQSTVLKPTSTGAVVLADGASYQACDQNTGISIGKTGSSGTTATAVDVILTFALEAA